MTWQLQRGAVAPVFREAAPGVKRRKLKPAERVRAQRALSKANALYQAGKLSASVAAARKITVCWPQLESGWRMLAVCLQGCGDHENAAIAGQRALELDGNSAEAHNVCGCASRATGKLDSAGFHFARAIELTPDYAEAHSNLGRVLTGLGRHGEAEVMLRHAIALSPGFALAHYHLGCVLRELDRPDEAQQAFEEALRVEPSLAAAHMALGHLLTQSGDLEAAAERYREGISLEPRNGALHYHLAFVKKFADGDPDLEAIQNALRADGLSTRDTIFLNYAAGKAMDDIGRNYSAAFQCISTASRLQRSLLTFDPERTEKDFKAVAQAFTREIVDRRALNTQRPESPIFIVGMPRSGTTLVEQILAGHSDVSAAGERDDLSRVCKTFDKTVPCAFPQWAGELSDEQMAQLGGNYLELTMARSSGAVRTTDKMLTNFKLLGVIALILPNARVIHVRRHPLDTCLSCFFQPFTTGSEFSYDLGELGRYYRAYHRLMQYWQDVLPPELMMTIDYEKLVDRPDLTAGEIVSFCGLDWQGSCLDFQNANRAVKTASAAQVRKKLYKTSVGRAARYEPFLDELKDALGDLSSGHPRH